MAVYERNYGRYTGELTPTWSRFLVLPRYSFQEVFQSKIFLAFYVLCFALPFSGLIMIYLHHNLGALNLFNMPAEKLQEMLPINAKFFWWGQFVQSILCYLVTLLVVPSLVAPDLRNNGLPLYLSRPFTRTEYVLGKLTVIATLLSLITWIPGLFLFAFQGYLDGWTWISKNFQVAVGMFICSWAWILSFSLLALAVSAWVKWKPVARIALAVGPIVAWAFALSIEGNMRSWAGQLISIIDAALRVGRALYGVPEDSADLAQGLVMPLGLAWATLGAFCLVSLWSLSRRLRAYEVVR